MKRFLEVLWLDLREIPRRPLFWVLVLILGFMAFALSNGNARIASGDMRVGGDRAWLTSEFAQTQLLMVLVAILYSFFVSIAAGMIFIRDEEQKVGPLLHATPLTPGQYVWGKYCAVLLGFFGVLGVHLMTTILFNHAMPHASNQEAIGPFVPWNYLKPAIIFAVPMLVFISGTAYALGAFTRKAALVFVVPIALVILGTFFLWDWSPVWLSPLAERVLQFIDLSGVRWINENWLVVDRGVAFYNRAPVGLDALAIVQRFACLGLGLGAVGLVHLRFPALLRGPRTVKVKRGARAEALAPDTASAGLERRSAGLAMLNMTAKAPGFLRSAWNVARVELMELKSHPGLYLFVPLILVQTLGEVVSTGAFDTPLLMTPGSLAVRQMGALTLLLCMLILFYTTESLQREKSAGFAPLFLSAPIPTSAMLLGKSVANVVVGVIIMLAAFAGSMILLLVQGTVPIRLEPFLLLWGVLLIPTFLLWTAFVCATFTVTSSRYATYAIGLAAMSLTGWFQMRGKMSWVTNWDLWASTVWSDISVLELDRQALVLNRLLALALAALFFAIAVRFFPRSERDAARIVHALSPQRLAGHALRLAPLVIAPLVLAIVLGFAVHGGRGGAVAQKKERDYWKRNSATWRDAKLPTLTAVELDLEVEPDKSALTSCGTYALVNRTADTLAAIPLTGGLHWKDVHWTVDGESAKVEDRAGLWVVHPKRPLAPGDSVRVGFAFHGRFPDGVSKNGGTLMEYVLPSGVVLTGFASTGMAPLLGYQPEVGVEEDRNKPDPREYPENWWTRTLPAGSPMFDGWITTRLRVTGPADMQHNATGFCESDVVKDGRRTTVWQSDAPVRVFNVVMGRWQVKKQNGAAVYYDARHPYNAQEMLDALVAARRWYGEWFAPYPYRELRLSEFPGLANYAQGPPTNITFSENIGFLTKSEPKANLAFWVAAHEAAHQWWPLIVMSADGPGGEVLSEGMAHFSTILLVEQARGLEQRLAFCRQIEDRYGNLRRRDSERPLVRMDGQLREEGQMIYDRGGFVLWMMFRLMGDEAGRAGLRDYIATYRDSEDKPLLEDLLHVMRRHAPDPAAFDAFTAQWFFDTVVPEFLVDTPALAHEGDTWTTVAKVRNVGSGRLRVVVAATRGERFPDAKKTAKGEPYADARTVLELGPGEEKPVMIESGFEPERIVVDPDVEVLMLRRAKAQVPIENKPAAGAALAGSDR